MKKSIIYIMMLLAAGLTGLMSCSDDYAQPPVILPEGGIGTGAWDSPMTAYQCRIGSLNPDRSEAWVTGYIVGVVNTAVGNVLNARCAQFEGPFAVNTNIIIAMTPDETNWENCATVQLPSGSVRDALNLAENPENLGKLVTIKGTTGEKYCGAYGIRSASDYNWGDKGKPDLGSGAWNSPFTVKQCLAGETNPSLSEVWVTGYIVGVIDYGDGEDPKLSAETAKFDPPFNVAVNILIAMLPGETNWENCATVQIPPGEVRGALNLMDNPGNLGKQITLKGETGNKYYGVYGVRNVTDYNWGDKGKEENVEQTGAGPFFVDWDASTSFSTYEARGWKNVMVTGGLSGWYIKNFSGNNYITTSAYLGTQTGGPYENWLISPAIDMSKLDTKTLEFITQAAYPADDCSLEVYAMTTDNPKTSTNTRLQAEIATPPASGGPFSDWVNSGKIDLSQFSGTIYIGWRYYSAKGGQGFSATYCIDDVNVGNAQPTTPDTPDTPPAQTDAIYAGLGEADASIDWTFDNVQLPAGVNSVWSWKEYNGKHYLNGSAFGGSAQDCVSIAYSPAISLAGVTGASVEFDHAAKFQTTIMTLGRFVVREKGATEWTELVIPKWPEAGAWKFASSGKIDISAFDGKEVEIGFKYVSSTAGADTWEIKNVKVTGTK